MTKDKLLVSEARPRTKFWSRLKFEPKVLFPIPYFFFKVKIEQGEKIRKPIIIPFSTIIDAAVLSDEPTVLKIVQDGGNAVSGL
jgi:hypothetical protein